MRLATGAALAAVFAALTFSGVARAEEPPAAVSRGAVPVAGHWTGAKLRCQKVEGKPVRCGTPSSFEVTFAADGTGSTPDESLPPSFTWRWLEAAELGLKPAGGGEEIKLFAVEGDGEALTFQAYVFLPTVDPNAPPESRYIHFVFDVNLVP